MIRIVRRPLVVLSFLAAPLFASNALADTSPPAPPPAATHAHVVEARGGWMEQALALPGLRDDQKKQIEALRTSVEPSRAAAKTARKGLLEALATQVAGGKIDRAALQPKVDAVLASSVTERAAERAALDKLHNVLDAKQRVALADAMESHGGGAKHHGAAKHGDHHAAGGMAKDLKLTDAQKKQIADGMRAAKTAAPANGAAPTKGTAKKIAEAFKQDKFAIDSVSPNTARAQTQEQVTHLLGAAQIATPVLTADQRNLEAARLRANAAKNAGLGL